MPLTNGAYLGKPSTGRTHRLGRTARSHRLEDPVGAGSPRGRGYPSFTTSAGWLGCSDDNLTRAATEAVETDFSHSQMKFRRDLADDIRRLAIVRSIMGPDRYLMIDAQMWEVDQTIEWVHEFERLSVSALIPSKGRRAPTTPRGTGRSAKPSRR